jgi:hypothetical protein
LKRRTTGYELFRHREVVMTRHQALQLLLARRLPDDVASIEATLRAITARLDAVTGTEEYTAAHQRLDDLLTARDRASERDGVLV